MCVYSLVLSRVRRARCQPHTQRPTFQRYLRH